MRIHLGFLSSALIAASLAACGGGGGDFDGDATITFKGDDYTPKNGVAAAMDGGGFEIGFGTGSIDCSIIDGGNSPNGTFADLDISDSATGTYDDANISIIQQTSNSLDIDGSTGTVTITASTADSISGSVDFDYTNTDGDAFGVHGSFTVEVCQ
ncbi:MAG TPA: hypothetical protein VGM88_31390 [Kofleriaceae bacterium]|jgi:hypothetical protein